jgi:hypothetical protein
MALMRTVDHPELLDTPLRKIFFMAAKSTPMEYARWINLSHTSRNFEDDLRYSEFGAVPQVAEGAVPFMDDAREGSTKRYQPLEFKLGYSQTEVLREDDLHGITGRMTVALRQSFRYLYEVQSYLLLNNATATTSRYVGFDSLALLSTAHTNLGNVDTQSNKPATDVTLSQLAIEAAVNAFHNWTGERGFPGMWVPEIAIVDNSDQFKAAKLFKNAMRYDTANHEENWVKKGPDDNGISAFIPSRYFTAANQWFILAKKGDPLQGAHDLNMVIRVDPKFMTHVDPLTGNFIAWGRTRLITSYGRWQGVYGSKGY